MTKKKMAAIVGFLLVVAFASGAGWYISGRDIRTFRDGLSAHFRDRGTVVFNTMKRAVEAAEDKEVDDSTRQVIFGDVRRALTEARRNVRTRNDSKVYAILNSYYLSCWLPLEQMQLIAKMQSNLEREIDDAKKLTSMGVRNDAAAALADAKKHNATVEESYKRITDMEPALADNSINCETAAAEYFAEPPATVPSEGLDNLCKLLPDEKPSSQSGNGNH